MPSRPPIEQWISITAKKYGIPERIFRAVGGQESGGAQTRGGHIVTSSAGAQGWGQIMPGTEPGFDHTDPYQNIEASAHYLSTQYKDFGSWRLALAAYNAGPNAVRKYHGVPPYPETQNYVRSILDRAGSAAALSAPTQGPGLDVSQTVGGSSSSGGGQPAGGLPDLGLATSSGLQHLVTGDYDPTKALGELSASATTPQPAAAPAPQPTSQDVSAPLSGSGGWQKWVKLAKSADRQGVPTTEPVLEFVGALGQAFGSPLTIGTGSNHNEHTVNGNVSDHWSGHAADIPATGAKLRQLGYLALRQAGMPDKAAKAAARKGGLYNVGGYQIIFLTNEGGNHYNHLHVGLRG